MQSGFFPVFFLFFIMGFGDLRAALVGFLPGHYHLSAGASGLLPFWGTLAFVLFALPVSHLASRLGLALLVQAGLALAVAGHLLPLARLSSYPLLLAGTFLAGTGLAAMQVAGPPLLAKLSAMPHFARDQVAAQFIQSLGSLCGPALLPPLLALGGPWWLLLPVLAGIAGAAWLGFWRMLRRRDRCGPGSLPALFPERAPDPARKPRLAALLADRGILLPAAGTFLYAGSEAGLATWSASQLASAHGLDLRSGATLWGPGLFFLTLALGRIGGVAVLRVVSGRQLLMISSGLGSLAVLCLMFGGRFLAVASMVLSGLGFATVWPVLYALTVENRPRQGTQVAGLMAMANCGGAVFPPLMGLVADAASLRWAFLLPLAGLAGIGALGALTQYAPGRLGWSAPARRD